MSWQKLSDILICVNICWQNAEQVLMQSKQNRLDFRTSNFQLAQLVHENFSTAELQKSANDTHTHSCNDQTSSCETADLHTESQRKPEWVANIWTHRSSCRALNALSSTWRLNAPLTLNVFTFRSTNSITTSQPIRLLIKRRGNAVFYGFAFYGLSELNPLGSWLHKAIVCLKWIYK